MLCWGTSRLSLVLPIRPHSVAKNVWQQFRPQWRAGAILHARLCASIAVESDVHNKASFNCRHNEPKLTDSGARRPCGSSTDSVSADAGCTRPALLQARGFGDGAGSDQLEAQIQGSSSEAQWA